MSSAGNGWNRAETEVDGEDTSAREVGDEIPEELPGVETPEDVISEDEIPGARGDDDEEEDEEEDEEPSVCVACMCVCALVCAYPFCERLFVSPIRLGRLGRLG